MKARVFKPNTDLAVYKARWFRHSLFSYPKPSPSPGPVPMPLAAEPLGPTVTIAPGVEMPSLSLGTCCGSRPEVGLPDWLTAGGVGIDSAWNYKNDKDFDSQVTI